MIEYRIIDLDNYPHRAHLEYFMTLNMPQTGMTVEVDVTDLKAFCKREQCSFFLTFMHVVALSAEAVPQIRQRIHRLTVEELADPVHAGAPKEGPLAGLEIREYVECPTSNTESTGNDLYCYCANHHHMPWKEYIAQATENQRLAREKGSLEEDPDIEAFCFPTCVPWVHYSDFIHPIADAYDSNPRISWGRFDPDYRGRLMMPLTIVVHHGLVDGLQMSRFYANVEENMKALIEGRLKY